MRSITQGDLCVNRSPVPPKTEGSCVLSAALAAANQQLLARRAALPSAEKPTASSSAPAEATQDPILPSHLGWGNAVLSASLRPKAPPPETQLSAIQHEENLRTPERASPVSYTHLTLPTILLV